jgi:hypothetical protein
MGWRIPRVVNIQKEPYDISIMRPSKWGNPYIIGRDGDREEVIRKYRVYVIHNKELMDSLIELEGKTLGCCCKPKRCHGDILVELIEKKYKKLQEHRKNQWDL